MSRKVAKRSTTKAAIPPAFVPVASWRYTAIIVLFMLGFGGLLTRALYLQVVETQYLQEQGNARYLRTHTEAPTRGMILDRHGQPLAISTPVDSIWMHPSTVLKQADNPVLLEIENLLELESGSLLALAKERARREFVYLERQVAPMLADQVLALGVGGINRQREYKRFYPAGPVAGHVLGFTDIDNVGQEGVERGFDGELAGRAGQTQVLRTAAGEVIEHVEQLDHVKHGSPITLSIDARIQYLAYRQLQAAAAEHDVDSGSVVALDAKTGEILAMVSAPDFNPNNRADLDSTRFRNRAIADSFEPGSTVKPLSVALALDRNAVDIASLVETGEGNFQIGAHTITDTKPLGLITLSEVVSKSSNIGASKVAMRLDAKSLFSTYEKLGFGRGNALGLAGEHKGILVDRGRWRPIEHATLAYGYGLAVNALQLARSYTVFTNAGRILPVSLLPVSEPPTGKKVFRPQTIALVNAMLEQAVSDNGTGAKARIPHYRVAGKTGTAHRLVDGQYASNSYLSIFAGFAPASDPDIVLVVVLNDPKGIDYYGGLVAAPVFSEVMQGALRYRNITPDGIEGFDTGPRLMIARPEYDFNGPSDGSGGGV